MQFNINVNNIDFETSMSMMNNFPMQTKFCEIVVGAQVILYSGEPLSHHVELASLNACAKSSSILLKWSSASFFSNRVPN